MSNDVNKIKILKKVKKLFDLANNAGSEAEAESAAVIAKQLLAKYDLEYSSVESLRDETCYEEKILLKYKYVPRYIRSIAGAVSVLYVCQFFWHTNWEKTKDNKWKVNKTIVFAGIQPDLKIAIHTFHFLQDYAYRKAKEYKFKGKQKTAYLNGFSIRIRDRFQELANKKEANKNTETGLCIIKKDVVNRYLHKYYPSTTRARDCPPLKWSQELNLGFRDADNVEINDAIEEQENLSLV